MTKDDGEGLGVIRKDDHWAQLDHFGEKWMDVWAF